MARTTVSKVHRCPACNAPLELAPGVAEVTCGYCNAHVNIERKAPPKNLQLPKPQPGGEVVLYTEAARRASTRAGGIILVVTIIGVLAPAIAGFVIFRQAGKQVSEALGGSGGGTAVSLPGTCAVNQTVVIDGETLELDGVALEAEANCKIEIRNSTITADKVVEAKSANIKLKVINSKLVGRKVALDLGTSNPEVEIDAKSSVRGKIGLEAGHNLKLTIEGGELQGEKRAVKADSGATVKLDGGRITADKVAIEANSLELEMSGEGAKIQAATGIETDHRAVVELTEGAHIIASSTAIETGHALQLDLTGGRIESEGDGLHAGHTLTLHMSEKSLIKAAKTAVEASYNVELELEDSRIEGAKKAVKARSKAKYELDEASAIEGEQEYDR